MPEKPLFEYTLTPSVVYITKDPANPSIATLTIGVHNDTGSDVECDWTSFIVQIGDRAGDLTSNAASITTSSSHPEKWTFIHIAGTSGQFRAEPVFPNTGLKQGESISFQLDNVIVNGVLGSAKVEIVEMTDGRREDTRFLNKSVSDLRIEYFRVTPNSIKPGESATLAWKTQSAARCTLTKPGYPPQEVGVTDSTQVSPTDSTTYILDAFGVGRLQDSKLVSVIRVRINEFRGPTTRIPVGGKAALWWRTEFATRCELKANGAMLDANAPLQAQERPYWVNPKSDRTNILCSLMKPPAVMRMPTRPSIFSLHLRCR